MIYALQASAPLRESSLVGEATPGGQALADTLQDCIYGAALRPATFTQLVSSQSFEKVQTPPFTLLPCFALHDNRCAAVHLLLLLCQQGCESPLWLVSMWCKEWPWMESLAQTDICLVSTGEFGKEGMHQAARARSHPSQLLPASETGSPSWDQEPLLPSNMDRSGRFRPRPHTGAPYTIQDKRPQGI